MKYFIVIVLIIYALRLLFRLLLPVALRQFVKKNQQNFNGKSNSNRPIGEVRIENGKKSNFDNNVEDIDFEEIK